jgi:hypothetical protein
MEAGGVKNSDPETPWAASNERSRALSPRPPPKPVREPSAPMTRWHGMMMGIRFVAFARPTARAAVGRPMAFAI